MWTNGYGWENALESCQIAETKFECKLEILGSKISFWYHYYDIILLLRQLVDVVPLSYWESVNIYYNATNITCTENPTSVLSHLMPSRYAFQIKVAAFKCVERQTWCHLTVRGRWKWFSPGGVWKGGWIVISLRGELLQCSLSSLYSALRSKWGKFSFQDLWTLEGTITPHIDDIIHWH